MSSSRNGPNLQRFPQTVALPKNIHAIISTLADQPVASFIQIIAHMVNALEIFPHGPYFVQAEQGVIGGHQAVHLT